MRQFRQAVMTMRWRHWITQQTWAAQARLFAMIAYLSAIAFAPGVADAAGLDQFIGFGDSTMDSGYFRYGSTGGLFTLGANSKKAVDAEIQSAVTAGASGAFVGPGVVSTRLLPA